MNSGVVRAILIAMFALWIWPNRAAAGNWSSGGGEILEHAQNPWFIDVQGQTTRIPYCIVAGTNFPVNGDTLRAIVADSIKWWDLQFSNAFLPENRVYFGSRVKSIKIPVNTSGFVEVPCDENPELSFQFGFLTNEQRGEFEKLKVELRRYVALTIRTDYSDLLRGRGFIYVSPDRGEDSFQGANIISHAWTADAGNSYLRLRSVVAHELGHVFGLAHSGQNDSIMGARMAELTVSKFVTTPGVQYNWHSLNNAAVFFPNLGNGSGAMQKSHFCEADKPEFSAFRKFFEIQKEQGCFRIHLSLGSFRIQVAEKEGDAWMTIGEAKFGDGGRRRHSQLVTLWLPATQKLFPGIAEFTSAFLGPASSEIEQRGTYVAKNGSFTREIFLQVSPRFFQLGGIYNNQLVTDFLPISAYGQVISGWQDQ